MASITIKREPHPFLDSPYRPCKFVAEICGSNADLFVDVLFTVSVLENGAWKTIAKIRKQEDIDSSGYIAAGTPAKWFTLDISSIVRNELSYDLRAVNEYTGNTGGNANEYLIEQDMTLSTISSNTQKAFRVEAQGEYITNAGGFEASDTTVTSSTIRYSNSSFPMNFQRRGSYHLSLYWHSPDRSSSRYLTSEPNTSYIREDECQYLSMLGYCGSVADEATLGRLYFYDSSGSQLPYNMYIDKVAVGDGSTSSGAFGNNDSITRVAQIGIGTKNIMKTSDSHWNGTKPSNLDDVSYYTFRTHGDTTDDVQGVLKKYIIDRTPAHPMGNVRFHFQNRLGGIDSYTCLAGSAQEIKRSSSVYQQTLYRNFTQDMGVNKAVILDRQAISDSIGGNLDIQRHSLNALSVNAQKTYTASTRPINADTAKWLEELYTSANVWIEVPIPYSATPSDDYDGGRNQLIPVVMVDGSMPIVNSEGLTTMEFKYALSNNTMIPSN